MKHIRRLTALLLCLLMSCAATSALAASKTFTAVPTLKITVPKRGIASYGSRTLTFNCSAPGFLTVNVLTPTGEVLATLFDNQEVHSKATEYSFRAINEDESPLAPGDYTLVGTLVSQYGVASKETTTTLKITEITEEDLEAYQNALTMKKEAEKKAAAAAQAASTKTTAKKDNTSASSKSSSSAASSTTDTSSSSKTASVSQSVSFASGTSTVGDEGLEIGVGVSDVAQQDNAGYWGLTADSSDAEIWAALTRPLVSADTDEQKSAYIYDSVKESRKKLGSISGYSQGVNVITERSDGWSLVEAFRKEDGAFVRGYVRTNKLRTVDANTTFGIVIDKKTQTLIVYKDGVRLGSCRVSTGLATPKYLHRETPAGEYIIATRRGTTEYYGQGFSKYTMRINDTYYLSEIPTTKKNGSDYSILSASLGEKATRGNICIANEPSTDGGINAEWIWNATDEHRKAKVLIFDDKNRTDVPVGE